MSATIEELGESMLRLHGLQAEEMARSHLDRFEREGDQGNLDLWQGVLEFIASRRNHAA